MAEEMEKTEEIASEETDGYRKMSTAEFWIRFSIWVLLALVAPLVYIAVAYGMFTTSKGGDTCLTGWGTVAIMFTCIMLMVIVSQAKKGMRYGSMARQCIDGYTVLIPIFCLIVLLEAIKGNIESFERFLIVMIICEAIAIPVNPMRKWAEQNHIERAEGFITRTLKKAFGKDKKEEKK